MTEGFEALVIPRQSCAPKLQSAEAAPGPYPKIFLPILADRPDRVVCKSAMCSILKREVVEGLRRVIEAIEPVVESTKPHIAIGIFKKRNNIILTYRGRVILAVNIVDESVLSQ